MRKSLILCLVAMGCVPVFSGAQTDVSLDSGTDIKEVRRARRHVVDNGALDDSVRARALEKFDQAIGLLESAEARIAEAAVYDKERRGVPRMTELLKQSLEKNDRSNRYPLPEDPTLEQAEDVLARERSRLAADRTKLRDIDRLAEERKSTRNSISQRLGTLDQELDVLNDSFRSVVQMGTHPEIKTAERLLLRAQREDALAEITNLRASLSLLDARGTLIPLERDLAQRRVFAGEGLIALLEEEVHRRKAKEFEREFSRIVLQCSEASTKVPEIEGVANETQELAEHLLGVDGVVVQDELNTKALLKTRKHLDDLGRIVGLTRRKFAAFGRRGSITRWWPAIPVDFPKTGVVKASIERLELRVPEVEHQLITFEERRAGASEYSQRVLQRLKEAYGEDLDPEIERVTLDLLTQRRDLLDQLVQDYSRYSNELVENLTVSRYFSGEISRVERFLYGHVLWYRSVPKPVIPRMTDLKEACLWVIGFGRDQTQEGPENGGHPRLLPRDLFFGMLLMVAVVFRKRLRLRLEMLAEMVRGQGQDLFRHTWEALATTILLAAPVPFGLYLFGSILGRGQTTIYVESAAEALIFVAMVAGFMELTRQLLAPSGFVEAHLGWPSSATRPVFHDLSLPQVVSLPLLFVSLQLARAGARFNSPPELQVFNNSLGRLCFVIGVSVLGVAILGHFRPKLKTAGEGRPPRGGIKGRWARYAFPVAGLYAYPVVFVAVAAPVVLAVLGYYVTGLLLAYQMLRMLWLLVGLLIFGGLLYRWYWIRQTASEHYARGSGGDDSKAVEQVRQLFRFLVVLAATVGFFSIWSDALPMLEAFKRVQVFPRVMLTADTGERDLQVAATAATHLPDDTGAPDRDLASDSPDTAESGVSLTDAVDPEVNPAQAGQTNPLTLWALMQAILAGVISFILGRNLPGLFEIVLRRRTRLDSGARIAFSTLVRYAITMVGVVVVSRYLGISWSSVHWLAAALTFGLGFGLQEIVANFVSGLILLAERPIRVGDVVTVGNLMGKVTRIEIRATTITLWDRSEMIVPNKEFITTKLVNWTLSDSKRRIEIPVRVVYGTDLELVKATMVEAALDHPNVLDEPSPHVLLLNFGDDAVHLELRFVVEFGKGLATKDEVQMTIDRTFRENGIGFALPQLEVSLPEQGPVG